MNKDEMKNLHWGKVMITVKKGVLDRLLQEHRPVRRDDGEALTHKPGLMQQQLPFALV